MEYACPECGFLTKSKHSLKHHLFFRKKQCTTLDNIVLTDKQKLNLEIVSNEYLKTGNWNTITVTKENNELVFTDFKTNKKINNFDLDKLYGPTMFL